jgi:hypothetical protein
VVLGSKGEVANAIRRAQAAAEAECGRKLRVLRTDNGCEFTAAEFASYCADEGVQRHYSASYSLQPDGCGDGSGPPQAVGNACYLLGRGGSDGCLHLQPLAHQGSQRQDAVRGLAWAQAAVSHLRVFGCLAFGKELGHIGQIDDSSTLGVFIGYVEGSKAYRILDPGTQYVRMTRDVVFDERRGWA